MQCQAGAAAVELRGMGSDGLQREVLPIPDRPHVGLVTYDAKDPATSFPPITPLRPPLGGAECAGGLDR